jgi:CRP-like cAMP-binding protein
MALDVAMDALAGAGVFAGLSEEQLRLLAFSSERRDYQPGEVVYHAGSVSDGAYVLIEGEIEIDHGDGKPLSVAETYATVGELALVAARPRPATVTAKTEAAFIYVPREGFMKLIEAYPELAGRMAARVREQLSRYVGALQGLAGKMKD